MVGTWKSPWCHPLRSSPTQLSLLLAQLIQIPHLESSGSHPVPTRLYAISTVWIGLDLPGLKPTSPSVKTRLPAWLSQDPLLLHGTLGSEDALDMGRAVIPHHLSSASPPASSPHRSLPTLLVTITLIRPVAPQSCLRSHGRWGDIEKIITSIYLVLVGGARECQGMNMAVRRQPMGLGSPLQLGGSQGLNSGLAVNAFTH